MIENRLSDLSGGRFSFFFAAMKNNEEKYSLCALNHIFGFEPKVARALTANIGSASEIFRMAPKEIDMILGPWSKYKGRIGMKTLEDAVMELDALAAQGISFIGYTESGYPELLADCEDAPVGLYVRSRTPAHELFCKRRAVAVIGTRDISPYGQEWCSRIVRGLGSSEERPVIVSGLALGTDISAHRQALESGLPTIAVMATGPDSVYPYRHRGFAERIASTEGCALITDYPPGTAPLAIHFLRRNRIIAGISDTTILVESRIKGGGMMTSRLAYSYNRDVYALPGRIDDPRSQGCNMLIKEKIADAIDSVDGLLDSMGLHGRKASSPVTASGLVNTVFGSKAGPDLVFELSGLLSAIVRHRGITMDDLSVMTGTPYSRIRELTGLLEMEGLISVDLLQRCTASTRISR